MDAEQLIGHIRPLKKKTGTAAKLNACFQYIPEVRFYDALGAFAGFTGGIADAGGGVGAVLPEFRGSS